MNHPDTGVLIARLIGYLLGALALLLITLLLSVVAFEAWKRRAHLTMKSGRLFKPNFAMPRVDAWVN
jgi:hypothetical protein